MDFTAQYSFPGPQGYHAAAFMPLTPSQSAGSDDFSNTSPPVRFFLPVTVAATARPSRIPESPTPTYLAFHYLSITESSVNVNVNQDSFADRLPHADQFTAFDFGPGFGNSTQQQQQQQQQALFPGPPTPPNNVFGHQGQAGRSPSTNGSINGSNSLHSDILSMAKNDGGLNDLLGTGGSDEEDSLTPAQSRRKAQNRAAQRAFRERKEKHVKDLESKLANLEAAQKEASDENERLRRDLQKMSTENEILRATSSMQSNSNHSNNEPEAMTTGPMTYKPTDFYTNVLQGHKNQFPSHRIVTSDDGQRLLAAGAAWDYIVSHELYKRGLVDVSKVSDLMKHCAKCDGQGPVFSERDIRFAIEQSVASGSDDLL
ncbi:Fluconazole resistance 3-like protein [Cladobotryum mycophilum]|uniref:Fluconazole resistance 3-like protein n=1 Tax=Cladobotryum mycophilum TaxID=491253 RepID=A0ABR0T455_9HYPO